VGAILGAGVPLLLGGYVGFQIAHIGSRGGMESLGAILLGMGFAAMVGVVLLVAGVAFLLGRRGVSRGALAAAGLLAAGGLVGFVTVPVFGLEYRAPVDLFARGTASVRMDTIDGFEPRAGGAADCSSQPDSEVAGGITGLDLGELHGGTLRGGFNTGLEPASGSVVSASFWVEGSDLPEGAPQPLWAGEATIEEVGLHATTGRLTFSHLGIAGGATGEERFEGWPPTLSGELSWQCEAWLDPAATPRPPSNASLVMALDGTGWVSADGPAVCEYEATGSAWSVAGEPGALQGTRVSVAVDLNGDHRAGEEVLVTVQYILNAEEKEAFEFIPNWEGNATLTEVSRDEQSGRAEFTALQYVPPPDERPASLAGAISWDCSQ
jgi:hypothetical protein